MSESILGLVPARGGSKGVHRKNVREVNGRPLLAYSVDAGQRAEAVDRVVVSSDDPEIRSAAADCGADVIERPAELATDEAPTEPVIVHAVETLRAAGESYDLVVLLQPTSPLRTATHVDEALEHYRECEADTLVSVTAEHPKRWRRTDHGAERVGDDARTRRQDMEPEYVENGAIYVVPAARFLDDSRLSLGHTVLYEMDEAASIDVDTEADLRVAACLLEVTDR